MAGQRNSFRWQNLHDLLTHSRIRRQSKCCNEKFIVFEAFVYKDKEKPLGYVDLMDRWINKAEDV